MELRGFDYVAIVNFLSGYNTTKDYAFALYNDIADEIIELLSHGNTIVGVVNPKNEYAPCIIKGVIPATSYTATVITAEVIAAGNADDYFIRQKKRTKEELIKKKKKSLDKAILKATQAAKSVSDYENEIKNLPDNERLNTLLRELKELEDM